MKISGKKNALLSKMTVETINKSLCVCVHVYKRVREREKENLLILLAM